MVWHHHAGAACLSFPCHPGHGQMGHQGLDTACVAEGEQGWEGWRCTGHCSETAAEVGTCWHLSQGLPSRMPLAGAEAKDQAAGGQH